jgi:hypothetical protein
MQKLTMETVEVLCDMIKNDTEERQNVIDELCRRATILGR